MIWNKGPAVISIGQTTQDGLFLFWMLWFKRKEANCCVQKEDDKNVQGT